MKHKVKFWLNRILDQVVFWSILFVGLVIFVVPIPLCTYAVMAFADYITAELGWGLMPLVPKLILSIFVSSPLWLSIYAIIGGVLTIFIET